MKFNPGENYAIPKDYRESTPISQPDFSVTDKSWGTLFEGLGKTVGSALDVASKYEEADAIEKTRNIVYPARAQKQAELTDIYGRTTGKVPNIYGAAITGKEGTDQSNLEGGPKADVLGTPPPVDAQGNPIGSGSAGFSGLAEVLPQEPAAPPPEGIKQGLDRIKALTGAKAKGEISPTEYWGNVDARLSSLRDRYRGYVDVIDGEAARILGTTPANAYITSITSDINSYIKNNASETDKMLTFTRNAIKEGLITPDYYQYYKNTGDETTVLKAVSQQSMFKRTLEMRELARKDETGTEERANEYSRGIISDYAANRAATHMARIQLIPGVVGMDNIVKFLQDPVKRASLSPDAIVGVVQQVESLQKEYAADVWKYAHEVKYDAMGRPMGKPLASDLKGKSKDVAELGAAGGTMLENIKSAFADKNIPLAATSATLAKMYQDTTNANLLRMPQLGPAMAVMSSDLVKNSPQAFKSFMDTHINTPGVTEAIKGLTMTRGLTDLVSPQSTKNITETIAETTYDINKAYPARTPEDAKKNQVMSASAAYSYIKQISDVAKTGPDAPEDGVKLQYLMKTFDPNKTGLIDQFAMDQPGIIGKYGIWNQLTNPAFSSEVMRLSKTPGNANLWNNYKVWMEKTYARELFAKDIINLDSLTQGMSVKVGWDDKNYRFTDPKVTTPTENKQFAFQTAQGKGLQVAANARTESAAKEIVKRLNDGLANLVNVYKADGSKDPNAAMVEMFAAAGYSPMRSELPQSGKVSVTEGLPQKMFQAILNAQESAKKAAEEGKKRAKDFSKTGPE